MLFLHFSRMHCDYGIFHVFSKAKLYIHWDVKFKIADYPANQKKYLEDCETYILYVMNFINPIPLLEMTQWMNTVKKIHALWKQIVHHRCSYPIVKVLKIKKYFLLTFPSIPHTPQVILEQTKLTFSCKHPMLHRNLAQHHQMPNENMIPK